MSALNEHDIGDVIRLRGTFEDATGVPANPTAVALRIRKPDGTVATPSPSAAGTGIYEYLLSPDQAGWWTYRFIGTGANAAAEEARFFVRTPIVPLT